MEIINFLLILVLFAYIHNVSKRTNQGGQNNAIVAPPTGVDTSHLPPLPPLPGSPLANADSHAPSTTSPASAQSSHAFKIAEDHSISSILSKVGVLALLFGLAFFLKFAIDQGWISIWTRLVLGFAVGGLFLILSQLWIAKYRKYALALAGCGLGILYLTTFAGYEYYHVINQLSGLFLMIIFSIIGVLLAWRNDSKVLGTIAWAGGYLAPRLLSVGDSNVTVLFSYLTILNVGVLLVLLRKYWYELALTGLIGTALNFWVWYDHFGQSQTILLTLIFLVGNMAMIVIVHAFIVRHNSTMIKEQPSGDDAVGAFFGAVALLYGIMLFATLVGQYEVYRSAIMLLVAIIFALAYVMVDRLEHVATNRVLSFVATLALVLACYWQFQEIGQILSGLIVSLGLLAVGITQRRLEIRFWAAALLVLVSIKSLFITYNPASYQFIINSKFGVGFASVVALALASYFYPKEEVSHTSEKGTRQVMVGAAIVLLWALVSIELWHYFDASNLSGIRDLLLSLWWLSYGVILAVFGSVYNSVVARKLAIAFFGLAVVKVFLYDVQNLDLGYRVVSFISLGVILLAASFGYQKNREKVNDFIK